VTGTGSAATRLIVLRGNSASGKSSLARSIRAARPRGIAIVGQDQLRREILHVNEEPGNLTVDYLDLSARYALDHGLHVIMEGILYADIYASMLTRLLADHRGTSRCYRYALEFEETVRRHAGKPQAAEYGPDALRRWWRADDPLTGVEEQSISSAETLAAATARIISDCGWVAEPTGS
jgi:hypothetical protein